MHEMAHRSFGLVLTRLSLGQIVLTLLGCRLLRSPCVAAVGVGEEDCSLASWRSNVHKEYINNN